MRETTSSHWLPITGTCTMHMRENEDIHENMKEDIIEHEGTHNNKKNTWENMKIWQKTWECKIIRENLKEYVIKATSSH